MSTTALLDAELFANGSFESQKSAQKFPSRIKTLSNTNLILDTLRQLDEQKLK